MAMEAVDELYGTVKIGPSCSLNSRKLHDEEYVRVLVRSDRGPGADSIFLTEVGNVRNYHAEAIDSGLTREDVDKAFADCPCHDPANVGKKLGRAGCLALIQLNQQEI